MTRAADFTVKLSKFSLDSLVDLLDKLTNLNSYEGWEGDAELDFIVTYFKDMLLINDLSVMSLTPELLYRVAFNDYYMLNRMDISFYEWLKDLINIRMYNIVLNDSQPSTAKKYLLEYIPKGDVISVWTAIMIAHDPFITDYTVDDIKGVFDAVITNETLSDLPESVFQGSENPTEIYDEETGEMIPREEYFKGAIPMRQYWEVDASELPEEVFHDEPHEEEIYDDETDEIVLARDFFMRDDIYTQQVKKEHAEVQNIVLPEQDPANKFFYLNLPYNPEDHKQLLPKKDAFKGRAHRDPHTIHHSIPVTSIENICEVTDKHFKTTLEAHPLFRANIIYEYTLERPVQDGELMNYNYSVVKAIPTSQNRSPMYIRKEQYGENYEMFCQKIRDDLAHLYELRYVTSSVRPICVYRAILIMYLVKPVAGKIVIPKIFTDKCRHIISYQDEQYNLCWWLCAYMFNHPVDTRKPEKLMSDVKKMCAEFYGHDNLTKNEMTEFLQKYPGFDMAKEIDGYMKKYKHNVMVYETDSENKTYEVTQKYLYKVDKPVMKVLLITGPLQADPKKKASHIMFIKNLDGLTGKVWCPICHNYCVTNSMRNGVRDMEAHKKICKGIGSPKISLQKTAKFYLPHIMKNRVLQYLVAHKQCDLFGKPLSEKSIPFTTTTGYITYDFETIEQTINEKITEKSESMDCAQLCPLSVAMTVHTDKDKTFYWDIRSGEDFIVDFLDELFKQALLVKEYNLEQCALYKHLQDENDIDNISYIYKYFCTVKVLGFNSSRFDSHFLMKHLHSGKCAIKHSIGSSSALKAIKVSHKDYSNVQVSFIDAMNYTGGMTLKQFAAEFGGVKSADKKVEKGVFPYNAFDTTNYNEVLSRKRMFSKKVFFNKLSSKNITDESYLYYIKKIIKPKFTSHWGYLQYYNELDTKIMCPALDNYITDVKQYGIDLLSYVSLSSFACATKYSMCYANFKIDGVYSSGCEEKRFVLSKVHWSKKCRSYAEQDAKKKLDVSGNVSDADYDTVKDLFENGTCYICGSKFSMEGRHVPTLDRIDNDLPHTLSNTKPCCMRCNSYKSNRDEHLTRLWIQLDEYCHAKHLPCNISRDNEASYHMLRKGITGGLSNVMHRGNLKGVTKINKFSYDSKNKCYTHHDTENIVSHVAGVDFNSLYPSCYSSAFHEFIRRMGYDEGRFYMPGRVLEEIHDDKRALEIIRRGKDYENLYVVEVEGYIPEYMLNKAANFPPIIRNYTVEFTPERIGQFMYNNMVSNGTIKDGQKKSEKKLTNLSSTMGTMMSFSNYYLQWLIDEFDFKISAVGLMTVFDKHTGFESFVTTMMRERVEATLKDDPGRALTRKIMMNGSYGYDIKNDENFTTLKYVNEDKLLAVHMRAEFRGELKITDDCYQVTEAKKFFGCDTPIHEGYFTLDVAKVWYLNFIYNFLYKSCDTNKMHFAEGDTDSMYFAIAGDVNAGNKQGFNHIITDKKFWDENVGYFLPDETITDKKERMINAKKILGACFEHSGDNMICLGPKCYTIWTAGKSDHTTMKSKGYSVSKNASITPETYRNALNGQNYSAMNGSLMFMRGDMHRVNVMKTAISGIHTKMICKPNGACLPFL